MDVLTTLLALALQSAPGLAQDYSDFSELDLIEAELDKNKIQKKETTTKSGSEVMPQLESTAKEITNISDLRKLEPFDDVAVIHPRFQPKSKRFQFNFGGAALLNDPWFNQFGASFKAAYHVSEFFGLEIAADQYTGSESSAAQDLRDNLGINTASFVRPKSYSGIHLYLSPIYGKMSLFNKRIVPYDVFFTLGVGSTELELSRESQASTFHFGAGQIFAFSRNAAFRWDIRANIFSAQANEGSVRTTSQNVIMALGFSYFLPEVNLR